MKGLNTQQDASAWVYVIASSPTLALKSLAILVACLVGPLSLVVVIYVMSIIIESHTTTVAYPYVGIVFHNDAHLPLPFTYKSMCSFDHKSEALEMSNGKIREAFMEDETAYCNNRPSNDGRFHPASMESPSISAVSKN
jgi:hypothetical protein